MTDVLIAYKAFNTDLSCRGFQYEVGKSYDLTGAPRICDHGFHACENPFDVFNYYPIGARLARVLLSGAIDRKKDGIGDSKVCGASIEISAELQRPEFIKAGVAWVVGNSKTNLSTGNYAHAASTGNRAHAASTGNYAHAASTGDSAHAASTGNYAHAASTGADSISASIGPNGTATAGEGGAISLSCFTYNEVTERLDLIAVRSSLVGQNGVEAGKTYKLSEAGEFIEAQPS